MLQRVKKGRRIPTKTNLKFKKISRKNLKDLKQSIK